MLKDYIKVFKNVVPVGFCDVLRNEFEDSNEWLDTTTSNNDVVNKHIRSATVICLSHHEVVNRNKEIREKLDSALFSFAGKAMQQYFDIYPMAQVKKDTGYDLLRYQTGDFFKTHTDSSEKYNRCVSCSFGINDDYEGGEFAFFDRKLVVKVPKGAALLFPSNFMFPHEIMPVLSGTRYSVVTWFL
jgi:predicted 2-oxoglutarate/Fe(II)-dependent dioxygenase YbiX